MTSLKSLLLVFSCSIMILAVFYALTSFIFACLSQKPVSMSEAGVVLLLAMLITYIHNQRGWQRISVIGLHILGFLFAALRLSHHYYELKISFWHFRWIPELLQHERIAAEWPILILVFLCAWILWFCGIRMITRPVDQTTVSDRFDFGLGYLLFLLLMKLIIAAKDGSISLEHSAITPIISYVILGLLSMGLVRMRSSSSTDNIIYFKGAGIALTFVLIILLLGGGLFVLFLPGLRALAETSSDMLKTATEPIGPILIAMLRFLLARGCHGDNWEDAVADMSSATGESGEELGIFGLISAYLMMGLVMVLFIIVSGFILFSLLKWLRSKSDEKKERKGIWKILLVCFHFIKELLVSLRNKILNHTEASRAAEKFYKRLRRWGRFSGLRHMATETPKEYGIRLGGRFPQIEKEIRLIIHMHDETIYGCIPPGDGQISRAKYAMRRIRTPLLWFTRIKSLCFDNRI